MDPILVLNLGWFFSTPCFKSIKNFFLFNPKPTIFNTSTILKNEETRAIDRDDKLDPIRACTIHGPDQAHVLERLGQTQDGTLSPQSVCVHGARSPVYAR